MTTYARPHIDDEEMQRYVARCLCEELSMRSGESLNHEAALRSMRKALDAGQNSGNLEQALAAEGWAIDCNLIEVISQAETFRASGYSAVVSAWVRKHNIPPQCTRGSAVEFSFEGNPISGEVIAIDREHATYTVACASGDRSVVPYEAIHPLCPAPETFSLEAYEVT